MYLTEYTTSNFQSVKEDDFTKNLIYKLDDVSICPLTGYLIVD